MSLARRVTLLFAALLAVIAVGGAITVAEVIAQRNAQREVTRLLDDSLKASHRLAQGQVDLGRSVATLLQAGDPGARDEVRQQVAAQAREVADLLTAATADPEIAELIAPLSAALAQSKDAVLDPLLVAVDADRMRQARAIFASEEAATASAAVGAAIQDVYDGIAVRRASVDEALARSNWILAVTLLVSALCIAATWATILRILRQGVLAPADAVRADLRRAATDRHQPITVTGCAEIASVATDAEAMRRELVRQADEAEAARLALMQDAPLVAEFQRTMMPGAIEVPSLRVHGTSRPGEGVIAGDWWDVIPRPDGSVAVVIADVSGHGVGAGTVAVQVRAIITAALADGASPDRAIRMAQRPLLASAHFVTLVIAVIDATTIRWVNAGHPPPIIVDQELALIPCDPTGPMLCALASTWSERDAGFTSGSVLLAYTDGLTEVAHPEASDLDGEELARWIRAEDGPVRLDPPELVARIIARARSRAPGLRDDLTVLCVARPAG